jgi:DHA2 family multidrug resistance protein
MGQRIAVTIAVMMAVLLQVLDTTIANVALPHMQASLSATQDTINWVLTSYIVASAIALPISGWLADKVGRKRLLLISVVVYRSASPVCGGDVPATEMVLFPLSGRQRPSSCRPGDPVRHQPTRAWPGDGLFGGGS